MLLLSVTVANVIHHAAGYTASDAMKQVGAQSWNESGWYADTGFKSGYSGFFCLCECNPSDEGIFCSGGGVHEDKSVVANFLGVFAQDGMDGTWTGDMVAYQSTDHFEYSPYQNGKTPPFHDHFTMKELGGRSNYTGNSQSAGQQSFIWRGYMSGVDCHAAPYCNDFCAGPSNSQYHKWLDSC